MEIDVLYKEEKWREYPLINDGSIKRVFSLVLEYLELLKRGQIVECCVVLTNDVEVQEYNKKYRSKNKPTNVLSFPVDGVTEGKIINLGDIFISLDTMKKESEIQSKNFYDHFFHLLLHSVLHLLGYDHNTDEDQRKMEDLEVKILDKLGIGNPYE